MELVNRTSFLFAPFAGRINYPKHSITLIVKGTFDLVNGGKAVFSEEPLYPTGDEFYPDDDEMTGGCRYESDFAYHKPRADLLLAGHCHTPGGKPGPACRVTFQVGSHSRTLAVFGNRSWKNIPGIRNISEPEPFTKMELKYENSFGGPGYEKNPVGKGFAKEQNESGKNVLVLPNIENPDNLIDSPGSRPEPAGFGPLGKMWKDRYSKLGKYKGDYVKKRWPWFPIDFDWGYFNAAPPSMQVEGFLKGDETLYCENLHPEHSRYESRLPGLRVRCFLNKITENDANQTLFNEVKMNLDTLWVDMDNEKLTLVWRGAAEVLSEEYEEIKHVFVMSEPLEKQQETLKYYSGLFLSALAEIEQEWAVEPEKPEEIEEPEAPEKPEVKIPEAAMAAAAGAVITEDILEEEAEEIDPEKIKSQAESLLKQLGVNLEDLPPDVREKVKKEMDKVVGDLSEKDPKKLFEMEQQELEKKLDETLALSGVDIKNLPPMSEKALDEQVRFMKELGFEEDIDLLKNEDIKEFWSILSEIFKKIGIDPEDLTPLIDEAKKQQEQLKKGMGK